MKIFYSLTAVSKSIKNHENFIDYLRNEDIDFEVKDFSFLGTHVFASIPEDHKNLHKILHDVEKFKVIISSGLRYSQDDFNNSEWFTVNVGQYQYPQPEDNYESFVYDLTYACKKCMCGHSQVNPFRLRKDFTQKRLSFFGLHWVFDQIFIRNNVKDIFEQEQKNGLDLSGLSYMEVINHKHNTPFENLLQLRIPVIDELSYVSNCPQHFCEYCNYPHYIPKPTIPYEFSKKAFANKPDIFRTMEYFHTVPQQLIIVSSKFVKVMKRYNLRGLGLSNPVLLK